MILPAFSYQLIGIPSLVVKFKNICDTLKNKMPPNFHPEHMFVSGMMAIALVFNL